MQIQINLCNSCAHRHRIPGWYVPTKGPPPCNAFPGGIPVEIWSGKDHREPVKGDGGVQYLMRPGGENMLAAYLDRKESEADELGALGD